jgi:cell division protein FtsW (lipid II flippase)
VPTAEERKELEKVSRARHIHFILLVVLICIASLTFLFPDNISPLVIVLIGVGIFLVGRCQM